MYAGALSRGQVVDAPPADLQQDESDEQHPQGRFDGIGAIDAIMDIAQISKPGNGRPSLLGIP